jgi:GTP-binding protein
VVPLDEVVAQRLRQVAKPVVFVANKADTDKLETATGDLFRLGYGEPVCVSAEQLRGRDKLLDAVVAKLPADADNTPPGAVELKVAIVGRRNVGKSTFINQLAEAERVIVSEVPGTTRDSIDVRFERDGKTFLAIDTAGVKQKKSLASDIEYYSMHRAERSIRRADVVLHFFDPRLRISRVDKQLAQYILENHKPAAFVVNKWDLAKDTIPTERWADYLREVFPMLDYMPIAFITAKSGKNVFRVLNLAQQLHKQAGKRVRTADLNRVIQDAMVRQTPPVRQGRTAKVYYAAQVAVHPPTVVLSTNGPEVFDETYQRYLLKSIRDQSPFGESPIKLVLRTKGEMGGGSKRTDLDPDEDATEEVPGLADEPVAEDTAVEEPPSPPPPAAAPAPPKPKRKKKGPETWEL